MQKPAARINDVAGLYSHSEIQRSGPQNVLLRQVKVSGMFAVDQSGCSWKRTLILDTFI